MTSDENPDPLYVRVGFPHQQDLELRFPSEYSNEILELLDEHQIEHGTVLELSANANLWIESVHVLSAAGGLGALATMLHSFLNRHKGKKFILDEDKVEMNGYSVKEIEKLLNLRKQQQAKLDAQWRAHDAAMDAD